jgi:hypothetical protein
MRPKNCDRRPMLALPPSSPPCPMISLSITAACMPFFSS